MQTGRSPPGQAHPERQVLVPPKGTLTLFTWEKHKGGALGASSWRGQCLLGPPSTCLLDVLRCGRDQQTALYGSRAQLWAEVSCKCDSSKRVILSSAGLEDPPPTPQLSCLWAWQVQPPPICQEEYQRQYLGV